MAKFSVFIATISFVVFLFNSFITGLGTEYNAFVSFTIFTLFALLAIGSSMRDEEWRTNNSGKIMSAILIVTTIVGYGSYCYARYDFNKSLEVTIKRAASTLEKAPEEPLLKSKIGEKLTEKDLQQSKISEDKISDVLWILYFYNKDDIHWLDEFHCEGRYMYNYAEAIRSLHNSYNNDIDNTDRALEWLNKIPNDYNGVLSDRINEAKSLLNTKKTSYLEKINSKEYKAKVAAEKKAAEEKEAAKKREEEAHRASHLYIDDPESKIYDVMGQPDSVNRHVNGFGETKQFVYYRGSKMICIYTENGFITDFQD